MLVFAGPAFASPMIAPSTSVSLALEWLPPASMPRKYCTDQLNLVLCAGPLDPAMHTIMETPTPISNCHGKDNDFM